MHSYGFLAVFAAGFALRRAAHRAAARPASASPITEERALRAVQHFNEQLERFAEVAVVLVIGALLGAVTFRLEFLWFVPLLLFAIRPASVALGTLGTGATPDGAFAHRVVRHPRRGLALLPRVRGDARRCKRTRWASSRR